MTRLPSVLLPGELPLAELCAARLDGELIAVDEGFLVADLPLGPPERASALLGLLPRGTVADRASAAWVHGATPRAPAIHSASIDRRHRLHPPVLSRVRFHEVRMRDADVVVLGGCPVTTPERTLIDLARARGGSDPALLRSLAHATGTSLEGVLARLEESVALSSRRIAAERLSAALGAPEPPAEDGFSPR